MSRAGFVGAVMALACFFAGADAKAATVTGLYNTGVDANGLLLADGARDTHYLVMGTGAQTYVYSNPAYAQPGNAKFVGVGPDPNANNPVTTTTYSTTFNLSGFNPGSVMLSGLFGVDDYGAISLNGQQIYASPPFSNNFGTLASFGTSQFFLNGSNTLTFLVANGGGPTGFAVSNLKVTFGVPGPVAGAGLPALAGSVLLLGLLRRRGSGRARG